MFIYIPVNQVYSDCLIHVKESKGILKKYQGALKFIKQILTDLKGEIDSNTIIVEDFSTPFSSMDTSPRQKIYKETLDLNDTLDQIDLRDIYRTFHQTASEYTFFSTAHRTFSRIEHMLSHEKVLINLRLKSYQASFLTTVV